MKNFAAPPPLILAIMEMVAMLFGCSVEWSAAKNLISESNFGKRFRDFDKDGQFWGVSCLERMFHWYLACCLAFCFFLQLLFTNGLLGHGTFLIAFLCRQV